MIKNVIITALLVVVFACSKKIEKNWEIIDFTQTKEFKIDVPENRSTVAANIYLEGDFTGKIYLSTVKGDSTMAYTKETLPKDRIFTDFYGGAFTLFLQPSDAKGHLNVKVVIP